MRLPRGLIGGDDESTHSCAGFWIIPVISIIYLGQSLPISLVYALFLTSQGVIQNFDSYREVNTLDTTHYTRPALDAAGRPGARRRIEMRVGTNGERA